MPTVTEGYTLLQVKVSPELRRRLKVMAAGLDKTLRQLVVEILEARLADEELKARLAQEERSK